MQVSDFEHFRDLLLARQQTLTEWMNSEGTLHGQEAEAVRGLLNQIKEALGRIENGSFGSCEDCDGNVETERLEVQPVRRVCLDCISAEEKAILEEDLYLASKIHRALLPQNVPEIDGFELDVRSLPASDIGGDYYDFIKSRDGQSIRIVIADAMGHGLPAGLLMSNLQGALRVLSSDIESPAPLIARLNQWLCRNVPVTKFISMVCLCIDTTGQGETRIGYANAGHVPPLVIRADGSVEQLDATGTVLGVHEEFDFEQKDITLKSGDQLILYTDGITEAQNTRGEEFETDRLADFIRSHRDAPIDIVIDDLTRTVLDFSGTLQAADDLTAIILRKN